MIPNWLISAFSRRSESYNYHCAKHRLKRSTGRKPPYCGFRPVSELIVVRLRYMNDLQDYYISTFIPSMI